MLDAHTLRDLLQAIGALEGCVAALRALAEGKPPEVAAAIGEAVADARTVELVLGTDSDGWVGDLLTGPHTGHPQPGDNREAP